MTTGTGRDMTIKERAIAVAKKFRLDSHHAIERFGVVFGVLAITGALVLVSSGFSAFMAGRDTLNDTALWTKKFETSKTHLAGSVDGVYTNELKDKALVMMHFDDTAKISYNAKDYQAFLLGSDRKANSETVSTEGVTGSFHVFGSTGYVGVLLEADQPFDKQVLNLTMRANAELSFKEQQDEGDSEDEVVGDRSFSEHDQWRVFINPGAKGTTTIDSLDAATFDPAQVYYDVVLKKDEQAARKALDDKLLEMRSNLNQIKAYSDDLATTKVDGLFLKQPKVPALIDGDEITGQSAAESEDGESTLALKADKTVPGGFDFNWRAGNVYDGYLDSLVPDGESYVDYLQKKASETSDTDETSADVNDMEWKLSDGSDLEQDYRSSDTTMRPLTNVMNNLSQAYQDYYTNKSEYQSDLMLDLLNLDVDLRDVQSNSSVSSGEDFLVTYQ